MNARMRTVARICLSLVLVACAWPQSPHSALEVAKRELKDKTVLLRGFPMGSKLKYTAQGELIDPHPGVWTVDGYLRVERVELKNGELKISGKRVCGIYNRTKKMMEWKTYKDKVELRFAIGDPTVIENALNRVFIRAPEKLADQAPAFWKKFLSEGEKAPSAPGETAASVRKCADPVNGIYRVCDGVQRPELNYRPEPEFSQFARRFRITGKPSLSCVVDQNGSIRDIEIVRPAGAGLDEQAAATLSVWRFTPAMREGKPVSVRIAVDFEFHLY
jgi:TonB family protein